MEGGKIFFLKWSLLCQCRVYCIITGALWTAGFNLDWRWMFSSQMHHNSVLSSNINPDSLPAYPLLSLLSLSPSSPFAILFIAVLRHIHPHIHTCTHARTHQCLLCNVTFSLISCWHRTQSLASRWHQHMHTRTRTHTCTHRQRSLHLQSVGEINWF